MLEGNWKLVIVVDKLVVVEIFIFEDEIEMVVLIVGRFVE